MTLALFDLDDTLLGGDSDHAWFEYLMDEGLVDATRYRAENARFFRQYQDGVLEVDAYLELVCSILAGLDQNRICDIRARFIDTRVRPMVLQRARGLVERHRGEGHLLIVITSTIDFVVEPIVDLFGIENLIAPRAERRDGKFTGRFLGTPSFREGKVARLNEWLEARGLEFGESWFYSDSHNDLPLLARVTHPCAVDPDAQLQRIATERNWPIISLRDADAH